MTTTINTRADLDALAGTPAHAAFMAHLAGTLWRLEKDDSACCWRAVEDNATIGRFGFTRADFPGAAAPGLPVYTPTMAEAQAAALAAIDAAAGTARARYITVGPGQEATYLIKEAQARAYKAAGYPAAAVAGYPMVQAEALALYGAAPTAAQIQAACDAIIAQADAWIAKAAQIEQSRIGGKRGVTTAADLASVEAARAATVAVMEAL